MIQPLLLVAIGVLLLYGGAEALVRGSSALGLRAGISPFVVGLTIVAFGTSMPELVVSVRAALAERAPIAVGNVVGSNIGNVALILGICAIIRPLQVHARIIRLDLPVLLLVTAGLIILLLDDTLTRVEGGMLATGLLVYTGATIRAAGSETSPPLAEPPLPRGPRSPGLDLLLVVAGLAVLVLGARFLVDGSVTLAQAAGMSEAVIGLTVVAIGTSLPELATSAVATLRGASDIAVGNVVGSNIFNVLGILGVAALIRPLEGTGMAALDLGVMMFVALLLLPLARTGFRLSRVEGSMLLAGYVLYVLILASGGP